MVNTTEKLVQAIQDSPEGIATLETLESLHLCNKFNLRTTLSRLSKSGRVLRLKRGVYSENPIRNAFVAAQHTYEGYLGFSSALYLHKLIAELPFTITVVTARKSALKTMGAYEIRAVAMKEKAIGFENVGNLTVSTRAKTLFDCLYLEKYSIERGKLIDAYRDARLNPRELKEFDSYVKRFIPSRMHHKFDEAKEMIKGKG